jgi:hypothetical protein
LLHALLAIWPRVTADHVCREDRVAVTLVAVRYSVTYSVWAGSMPGFEDVLSLERFFDFCGVGFSLIKIQSHLL